MTSALARENLRLQVIIDGLEKQAEHDAEIRSDQADRIVELEGELADAVAAGSMFASALRWAMPSYCGGLLTGLPSGENGGSATDVDAEGL